MRFNSFLIKIVHSILLLPATYLADAQPEKYVILPEISSINFKVIHMGFMEVDGVFKEFSGMLHWSSNTQKSLKVEAIISVNSINTNNESRDKTIKSEGYLDSETFPDIKYKSIKGNLKEKNELMGNLTIKDIKKPITLKFNIENISKDRILITGQGVLSRQDLELNFGPMDGLISDEIRFNLKIIAELNHSVPNK